MIDKKVLMRLRKATLLGISKCRTALLEGNGNFDEAIKILRKSGEKIAAKRVGREMKEGGVFVQLNKEKTCAVILGLGSETDFVAKSEGFREIGKAIAKAGLVAKAKTSEALLSKPLKKATCAEEIVQLAARVGENVAIRSYAYLEGPIIGYYVHTGSKLGAIAVLNKVSHPSLAMEQVARDIAMEVVISDPLAIDVDGVSPEILKTEKEILRERLSKSEKLTEADIEKLVERGIAKFAKENTLLEQRFIQDEKLSIRAYLSQIDSALAIQDFKRVQMGK